MSSLTKRAIDTRRCRATATEKRRFNKVLNGYIHTKHSDIYDEVNQMYNSLNEKYPTKQDLTKTKEWKTWQLTNSEEWKLWKKNTHTSAESSDDKEQSTTATEPATSDDEGEQSTRATESATTAVSGPAITTTTMASGPATVSGPATGESGENVIEMAVEELFHDNPENDINFDDFINRMNVDDVINDIMRDLQQDRDLQNILDDDFVQPQYMDEDEGIGLNIETELAAIIEPLDLEESSVSQPPHRRAHATSTQPRMTTRIAWNRR